MFIAWNKQFMFLERMFDESLLYAWVLYGWVWALNVTELFSFFSFFFFFFFFFAVSHLPAWIVLW